MSDRAPTTPAVRDDALRGARAPNIRRGRPRDPYSRRSTEAQFLEDLGAGYSRRSQNRIERHLAIAERYPFMRDPGDNWTMRMVADRFASLPPDEWDDAAPLFEGLPMKTARLVLENLLARRRPSERWELYVMPVVDARAALSVWPDRVIRWLRQAEALLRRVEQTPLADDVEMLLGTSRRSVTEALAALTNGKAP